MSRGRVVDGAPDDLLNVAHEPQTLHGQRAGVNRGFVCAERGESALGPGTKAGSSGVGRTASSSGGGDAAQGCSVGAVADVDLAALAEGPAEGGFFGRGVGPGREATRIFEVGGGEWPGVWKGRGEEGAQLGRVWSRRAAGHATNDGVGVGCRVGAHGLRGSVWAARREKETHKEQLPAQLSSASIGKCKDVAEGLVVALGGALDAADAAGDVCELAGAEGGLGGGDDGVEVRARTDGEEVAQIADGETADGAQVCAVDGRSA